MFRRFDKVVCLLILCFVGFSDCWRFNITRVTNCEDEKYKNAIIVFTSVDFIRDQDDFSCDTVTATYKVRQANTVETRATITSYTCPRETPGACEDNAAEVTEEMSCDRFHTDQMGVWTMLSKAMDDTHCAVETGDFKFGKCVLKYDYVKNYFLELSEDYTYRLTVMMDHPDAGSAEMKNLRMCVDLRFNIIPDKM